MTALVITILLGFSAPFAAEDELSITITDLSHGTFKGNARLLHPDEKTDALLMIVHGTLAHHRMEIVDNLQHLLLDEGVASLAINLTLGIDNRDGGMYDCALPHLHTHQDALSEIKQWLNWVHEDLPQYQHIYLIGHSRGGNQVAQFLKQYPDSKVDKAILLAPMTKADHDETDKAMMALTKGKDDDEILSLERMIYCQDAKASVAAMRSYYGDDKDMDTPYALNFVNKPILVLAAGADEVVTDLPERMGRITDNDLVELSVIEDADHLFLDFYIEDAVLEIMEFIQ